MIHGKLDIGDKLNIIELLGEVYDDLRAALTEFVTNARDAKASHILIYLPTKKQHYIKISDNGFGMDDTELKRVAENIGKSIKKYDPETVGEKGIGILGYQAIADKCEIVSRSQISDKTFSLTIRKGTLDYNINEEIERTRGIPGTDVYLSGLSKNTSYLFTTHKLNDYFKVKLRMELLGEKYNLEIIDDKTKIRIIPEHYKGEPFYITLKPTDFGNIKFHIYINPSPTFKTGKVSVCIKNRKVIDDITTLDEFSCEPWNLGKLNGEIDCDFLKTTTTRSGIIRKHKTFPVWLDTIKSIEKILTDEIQRLCEEHQKIIDQRMYDALRKAFNKALAELPDFVKLSMPISSSEGDKDFPGKGATKQDSQPKEEEGPPRPPIIRPSRDDEITRGKLSRGFNWLDLDFEEEERHRMSRYKEPLGRIEINRLHPEFIKEVNASQERKWAYFRKLTAKEVTKINMPGVKDPDILLEKMIELDIHAKRYME